MPERLTINHTFEKCRAIFRQAPELENTTSVGEIMDVMRRVERTELEGIINYAEQFADYIQGFSTAELPYILAGMNNVINTLLHCLPGADCERINEKYDYCVDLAAKRLKSVLMTHMKNEGTE